MHLPNIKYYMMFFDMLHSQSLFPVLCVIRTAVSVIRAERIEP